MIPEEVMKSLSVKTDSKIILLVVDGLGGLPVPGSMHTELEHARTPNLDALASRSICGVTDAISPGISPGSGPAHVALFGYDPLKYEIGRGVLEALGIGLELTPGDVAARGNFATLSPEGIVIDRRAGRLETEQNRKLCALLQEEIPEVDGVEVIIAPGKEHRFAVVFRGENLDGHITDTDPQKIGRKPLSPRELVPEAAYTCRVVNKFIESANDILRDKHPANTILMRGFASPPPVPTMQELYKLTPAAIATYPMYKGIARLVGMSILTIREGGERIEDEFRTVCENYEDYDFFYVHIKKPDSYGEDGNFDNKVKEIEEVDAHVPLLLDLEPEVLVVTGDHSTPTLLKSHSWHANPFMLHSRYSRVDEVREFSENACARGGLGRFYLVDAMPLMLAHALKLNKFGA